jgi:hypothetical protein
MSAADVCIFVVLGSCHFGNIIEYDTVTNLSWKVDARTHAIAQMVDRILSEPWAAAIELGREVPPLKRQDDCVVCFRVPSHSVDVFSHGRYCRIATNGTLETTANDKRTSSDCLYCICVFQIASLFSPTAESIDFSASAVGHNNHFKKDVRD